MISVIIPSFNRKNQLIAAVTSALDQSRPPHEVLVIDDGSNDGSRESLRALFGSRVRVISTFNRGVSHARNLGIQLAQSPWLAFLDSDDTWLPEKLACQWQLIMANPRHRVVHCNEIWVRNGIRVNEGIRHLKSGGWLFQACTELCLISPSAVVIHREVFESIGGFDESLPACEDYDFWLRMTPHFEVLYEPRRLLQKFGGHDDQLSRQYWGMDRFRVRALQKILATNLSQHDRLKAQQVLQAKAAILAQGCRKRGKPNEADYYHKIAQQDGQESRKP